MLTISNQSDYGIILISSLVGKKDYSPLSELLEKTKLPKRYLARIASILSNNKIIKSKEGKVGGYKLIGDLNKISLFDYLKIFEGDFHLCKCHVQDYCCQYKNICHHQVSFRKKVDDIICGQLKKIKLSQLIK